MLKSPVDGKPRLLKAAEIMSHMLLEAGIHDFPYQCTKGSVTAAGALYQGICYFYPDAYKDFPKPGKGDGVACDVAGIFAGYEVPFNHYCWRLGGPHPNGESSCHMNEFEVFVTNERRPEGTGKYFAGWSSLTHGELSK
jgi:hypothetical protein